MQAAARESAVVFASHDYIFVHLNATLDSGSEQEQKYVWQHESDDTPTGSQVSSSRSI